MISFGCFRLVFGCYLGGGAARVGVTGQFLAISLFEDEQLIVMGKRHRCCTHTTFYLYYTLINKRIQM